jgi:hypothetical protein
MIVLKSNHELAEVLRRVAKKLPAYGPQDCYDVMQAADALEKLPDFKAARQILDEQPVPSPEEWAKWAKEKP